MTEIQGIKKHTCSCGGKCKHDEQCKCGGKCASTTEKSDEKEQ